MQQRLARAAIAAATITACTAPIARAQPLDLRPGAAQSAYPQPSAAAPYAAATGPVVTRALLPGHWALHGARSVWVPPDTTLRPVPAMALVPSQYVWRKGTYVWIPSHYVY